MAKKQAAVQTTKLGNKTAPRRTAQSNNKSQENSPLHAGEEPIGRREVFRFFSGLLLLATALLMILSFTSFLFTGANDQSLIENGITEGISNSIGALGAYSSNYWINSCFGLAAYFIPVFLTFAGMKLTRAYSVRLWKYFINCTFLLFWFSIAGSYFLDDIFARLQGWEFINPGGLHGQNITRWLISRIGSAGTFLCLLITALAYLAYLSSRTIIWIRKLLNPVGYIKTKLPKRDPDEKDESTAKQDVLAEDKNTVIHRESVPDSIIAPAEDTETANTIDFCLTEQEKLVSSEEGNHHTAAENEDEESLVPPSAASDDERTALSGEMDMDIEIPEDEEAADEEGRGALEPYDPKLDLEHYKYPVLELLDKHAETVSPVDMDEQTKNKDQIIEVLQNFGVGISSIKATVGPTITLYEITPAKGVRISKIRNLEDDIALSLSALGIRIIAPIPGKGTIGIEVPNARPQMVSMESILNSKKFQETEFELPIALGKTITNEVFMVDLAKMPHLLVAGATGQGKSVGLNAIITSLLYKKHPAELKFVMVDPKKVEFSIYSPIENHFLAKVADEEGEPIITDVNKVVQTLKSLCAEMDTRYDLLKKAKARNLKEYNAKFKNRQLNPDNGHRFMPYIVVIIDEFGDLIMTAGKEIELPIARIAQLARAVGIHMIIATQRPTTNIITGTIKANFPARMAFKVSAMIDSRTILDRPGANQLIGRGDMLFLAGSEPVRVQCAFVDTPEVERIAAHIARQQSYLGAFELPRVEMEGDADGGMSDVDMTRLDPMFEDAARLIVATQQGSTSMIQRKFAIGYNRAGRLMDQLEKAGIVGPAQGSKPREVLCIDDNDLDMKLSNIR